MKFRVKDYCRIILYLPPEEKLKLPLRKPKPKRIEDEVDVRLSEDDSPVCSEDATNPSTNHRPPSYNPEDYAHAISKYACSSNIYAQDQRDKRGRSKDKDKVKDKDGQKEMTLKQFASLPELLRRLREDLKTAYVSFVKELVRDPHDGVTLLLDLLKMIQLAQSKLSSNPPSREQQIALRRAFIDEFECLSCLRCCLRCSDTQAKLTNYPNGLYCLSAATMSSLTRSRTLALQLLTKACDGCEVGHRQVLEAFSTLRLRFSEPVRYKFLVSMMLSHPHPSFQIWCLRFLNALVGSSTSLRERVYLQEEIGEAGFDMTGIIKGLEHRGVATPQQQDTVRFELNKWNDNYVDISTLEEQLLSTRSSNKTLHQELQNIRQSNMKLLEENVLLRAVGGEVEYRCTALKRRLENYGIPSSPSPVPSMTDSEISSWATNGQNTIKRGHLQSLVPLHGPVSPSRTMSTADSEITTSPDWTMIRSPLDHDTEEITSSRGSVPIPVKRSSVSTNSDSIKGLKNVSTKKTKHLFVDEMKHKTNVQVKGKKSDKIDANTKQQRCKNINLESNLMQTKCLAQINHCEDNDPSVSNSSRSLTPVAPSATPTFSSTSIEGDNRKNPCYENLPKVESGECGSRGSSEGDFEYERDVIVYEAITLGNDTIVLDQNSTTGSKTSLSNKSVNSQSTENSGNFSDTPSVRQSVRNFENMTYNKTIETKNDSLADETILRKLRRRKKSDTVPNSTRSQTSPNKSKASSNGQQEVSEMEVAEALSGLEGVIRTAESSISLNSIGTVKENPLCYPLSDDSESIVIPPPIPPRRSSGGSSSSPHNSEPVSDRRILQGSIHESQNIDTLCDTECLSDQGHSETLRSFKRFQKRDKGNSMNHNHQDVLDVATKRPVRRSESLQTSVSGYDSHRSYSPRHKFDKEQSSKLKENEIHINGRTYTKYTASSDVEENDRVKRYLASEAKRRRNRSIDDQLDQWFNRESKRSSSEIEGGRRSVKEAHSFHSSRSSQNVNGEYHRKGSSRRNNVSQGVTQGYLTNFGVFRSTTKDYRESDYGSNFVLSPSLQELRLNADDSEPAADFDSHFNRKKIEDPHIPTPDYGATPSGTLTNSSSGRHILDMPSGLY